MIEIQYLRIWTQTCNENNRSWFDTHENLCCIIRTPDILEIRNHYIDHPRLVFSKLQNNAFLPWAPDYASDVPQPNQHQFCHRPGDPVIAPEYQYMLSRHLELLHVIVNSRKRVVSIVGGNGAVKWGCLSLDSFNGLSLFVFLPSFLEYIIDQLSPVRSVSSLLSPKSPETISQNRPASLYSIIPTEYEYLFS